MEEALNTMETENNNQTEEINVIERNLMAVLFPGIVKNDQKAIDCLGGLRNISQVYSQQNKKRLGLSYQPDNPFVKKIYGDAVNTAGILLKVKIKKIKNESEVKREVTSTTVVGYVKKMHKFESMCDFQYLPIRKGESGSVQCILEQILPSGIDNFSFMSNPAPLFIVPYNFTRFDKPINYGYTDKRYFPDKLDLSCMKDDDVHSKRRLDRGAPPARLPFSLVNDFPSEPHEFFVKQKDEKCAVYSKLKEEYECVEKLFTERPVWSLNLIKYYTKLRLSSLKIIIPCLAFYMKDGPWRSMWVKFGYDPRKDPMARMYQTLDFRMRHQAGVRSMVMTKDQIVHYKKADRVRHNKRRYREEPLVVDDVVVEGAVFFRPGMAPTQRQTFYQFIDVKLPEVEELLALEPPPGYLCHEKRGWLPPNAAETCRDHIFRCVKETLLANHNAELKFEGSSDEDSLSEEDTITATINEIDESSSNNIVEM